MARGRKPSAEGDGSRSPTSGETPRDGVSGTGGADDPEDESTETLLVRMRDQFSEGHSGWAENRSRAEADDQFLVGEGQWTDADTNDRKSSKRLMLVMNELGMPYYQVTADIRKNQPQIKFTADDDDAHAETASVLQGMYRHMSYRGQPQANEHRLAAVNQAVGGGYGYYGIVTDWATERDFKLELKIRGVPNRSAIVDDFACVEPDWSDRRFFFLCDHLDPKTFAKKHPYNSRAAPTAGFLPEQLAQLWSSKEVPVIDYWYRDLKEVRTMVKVDDSHARLLEKDEAPPMEEDGVTPAMTRDVEIWQVKGFKTNGLEILKDVNGREITWTMDLPWIPWMLVMGRRYNVKGRWRFESVHHQAHDAQRLRNYSATAVAEHISSASKAPWMGPKGTFENFEYKWDTTNRIPWATLEYNLVKDALGNAVPPQRVQPPEVPEAAMAMYQMASQAVRDGTGMYPTQDGGSSNDSLGNAKSPMLPGAMRQQRTEGDANHEDFMTGLAIAMAFEARCFCYLVGDVYREDNRIVQVLGADGTEEDQSVTLNKPQPGPAIDTNPGDTLPRGHKDRKAFWTTNKKDPATGQVVAEKHYDLSVGKYGVRIQLGPGFQTAREQEIAIWQSIGAATGPLGAMIASVFIVKAMQVHDHEKAQRALIAGIAASGPTGAAIAQALTGDAQGGPSAEQLQQKLAQLMPVVQQMQQTIQQLQTEVNDKRRDQMIKAMAIAQKHVSETISSISHITGVKMQTEGDLLKHYVDLHDAASQRAQEAARSIEAVGEQGEAQVQQQDTEAKQGAQGGAAA